MTTNTSKVKMSIQKTSLEIDGWKTYASDQYGCQLTHSEYPNYTTELIHMDNGDITCILNFTKQNVSKEWGIPFDLLGKVDHYSDEELDKLTKHLEPNTY